MSANKECELPGADSCAIMEGEGEEVEDDVVYTKPSLLGKLKAIATKVHVTPRDHTVELVLQYVLRHLQYSSECFPTVLLSS